MCLVTSSLLRSLWALLMYKGKQDNREANTLYMSAGIVHAEAWTVATYAIRDRVMTAQAMRLSHLQLAVAHLRYDPLSDDALVINTDDTHVVGRDRCHNHAP